MKNFTWASVSELYTKSCWEDVGFQAAVQVARTAIIEAAAERRDEVYLSVDDKYTTNISNWLIANEFTVDRIDGQLVASWHFLSEDDLVDISEPELLLEEKCYGEADDGQEVFA